jgi:hypothetical protein
MPQLKQLGSFPAACSGYYVLSVWPSPAFNLPGQNLAKARLERQEKAQRD